jgi:hypothetical protein
VLIISDHHIEDRQQLGVRSANRAGVDPSDFSAARNDDYPLTSTDIGSTGYVRATTPWQRTVTERPGAIDWDLVRPAGVPHAGKTNLEAARLGYAPGRVNTATGQWDDVVLHHLLDDPRGGVTRPRRIQPWIVCWFTLSFRARSPTSHSSGPSPSRPLAPGPCSQRGPYRLIRVRTL